MSGPLRILGLGGSVRAESLNRQMLEMMLGFAQEYGAEIDLADVHTMNLPIHNPELPRDEQPAQLLHLIERMKWADGFIIASPTYLGSLSGAVKNTLDSLHVAHGEPRVYFDGRPVALASLGFHGQVNVINSLAFVTRVMGATVIPESVTISIDEEHYNPDIIHEAAAQQQMRHTVAQLLAWTGDLREPRV
ncbi:MAG: NAD(P)H-dependent oxidoreductase [Thermomicrobiales bacterium]|nr:NAD(P)H-dependent oxidoreductase [Thermomicrobiales bacterium]